ncbi:hypothetical protein [Paenibacillus glycanilyticus]|uniref:3D domain-containing protein n=1 Tax=Paenibacillus glycanilyticus TaxID=126569 RepID=A0ABQ6GEH2_9BACL|nr:hypothetical protein [Paenibacillus glycanilyticus]GLX68633.1 hypothetical protein MU1_29780 [Paenibacillus glycanilyticus]
MSDKSCGNKTYGSKSAYAILSTVPLGAAVTITVVDSIHDGTWGGFTEGNATVISALDGSTQYIPLNQVIAVYVP